MYIYIFMYVFIYVFSKMWIEREIIYAELGFYRSLCMLLLISGRAV